MKFKNENSGCLVFLILIAGIITTCYFLNKSLTKHISIKAKVVKVGQEDGYTFDKFHTPTRYHTVLINNLADTTKFCELSTDEIIYHNTNVGDSIYIQYKESPFGGIDLEDFKNTSTGFYISPCRCYDERITNYKNWFIIRKKK